MGKIEADARYLATSQYCTNVRRQFQPPQLSPAAAILNRPQQLC